MKPILSILALFLMSLGCSSNNSSDTIFEGDFSGTFFRVSDNIMFQTSEVSLTFSNGTFEGTSNINEYPAICNGTFEVGEDEVTFSNDCVFTADFDWTYILDGSFNYEVTDNELRIIREYNSSSSDTYTLIGEN